MHNYWPKSYNRIRSWQVFRYILLKYYDTTLQKNQTDLNNTIGKTSIYCVILALIFDCCQDTDA